jgi:hypothetical protein
MNSRIFGLRRQLHNKVIAPLINPLFIDSIRDHRVTTFVAGTERSGTTWISEVINYRRDYRYIFEPFWSLRVDICREFKMQQYIRPDDRTPGYLEAAQAILTGQIRNEWTDRYHRTFIASQRLVKDIRANLFLRWLYTQFPGLPIILVMRHPCAVVRSHLRRKHPYIDVAVYLSQPDLVSDFLAPFAQEIASAQTDFEKLVFRWCIENYVPLRQFSEGELHLAFYENLCAQPEPELDRMFGFLGKTYDRSIHRRLKAPSPQAIRRSAIVTQGNLIDGWRQDVTEDQVRRMVEILAMFGLDRIYQSDSMPDVRGAYALLETTSVAPT